MKATLLRVHVRYLYKLPWRHYSRLHATLHLQVPSNHDAASLAIKYMQFFFNVHVYTLCECMQLHCTGTGTVVTCHAGVQTMAHSCTCVHVPTWYL